MYFGRQLSAPGLVRQTCLELFLLLLPRFPQIYHLSPFWGLLTLVDVLRQFRSYLSRLGDHVAFVGEHELGAGGFDLTPVAHLTFSAVIEGGQPGG